MQNNVENALGWLAWLVGLAGMGAASSAGVAGYLVCFTFSSIIHFNNPSISRPCLFVPPIRTKDIKYDYCASILRSIPLGSEQHKKCNQHTKLRFNVTRGESFFGTIFSKNLRITSNMK